MSQSITANSFSAPATRMTDARKRKMGIWSLIPAIAFLLWCAYILIVNGRLLENKEGHEHEKVVTLISHNYAGSLVLFLLAFAIGLAVLIYFIMHLVRLKTMNGATKLAWMLFLTAFAPFSFPVFWWIELRQETPETPFYASLEDAAG